MRFSNVDSVWVFPFADIRRHDRRRRRHSKGNRGDAYV